MTIKEMKDRLVAINAEAEKAKDPEALNKLLEEARDLGARIEEAQNRRQLKEMADRAKVAGDDGNGKGDGGNGIGGAMDEKVKRGEVLMKGGKVTASLKFAKNAVSSSQTVMTQHTANDINGTFNEVSSLVDRVKHIPFHGGESYKRGFVKSYGGEAGYTAEGADYTDVE
ncbi:MAG: phage major capsid protein [Clostridia bacterium]